MRQLRLVLLVVLAAVSLTLLSSGTSRATDFTISKDLDLLRGGASQYTVRIFALTSGETVVQSTGGGLPDATDTIPGMGQYIERGMGSGGAISTAKPVIAVVCDGLGYQWNTVYSGSGTSFDLSGSEYALISASEDATELAVDTNDDGVAESVVLNAGYAVVVRTAGLGSITSNKPVQVFAFDTNGQEFKNVFLLVPGAPLYVPLYPVNVLSGGDSAQKLPVPSGEEYGFLGTVKTAAGKVLSLLASFLVSEAQAAATSESTVANPNGTFTFTQTVNVSSTAPQYVRPSNGGGFGIYSWYYQDFGWKHTFPSNAMPGIVIQSATLTVRAYDVDAEPFHGTGGEYDGVTGDGSWLNPQYLQGTNNTWSVTPFNVNPSALMDGSLDVWVDIDMHQYGWLTTLDYSQLQVVYSISTNSPPGSPTLSVLPVGCTWDSDSLAVMVTGPNPPDPDGDSVTYEYRWLVDVGTSNYIDDEFANRSNHTGNTVPASDTSNGDRWMVEVTPIDEHGARGNMGSVAFATIGQCNTPPIANAGGNQEANVNASFLLDGQNSYDPDGSLTGYRWELYAGGSWATIGANPVLPHVFTATGVYTIRLTVTDNGGATNSSLAYITVVVGNHPPIANAGQDQVVEQTGPSGAAVTLNGGASSDPDADPLTYNWTGPFGAASGVNPAVDLPAGASTVSLTVGDGQATSSPDTVVITVHDTTVPVIAAHADVTAEATSAAGAVVSYTSPATADAVAGAGTAICAPASGSIFALGTTTVTCNATDAAGNHATATSFTVTVKDTTAPVIAAHADVTAEATSDAGAVVSYTSPATADAVAGAGTAICAPASGSIFALGTTTVTCNATDAAGNHATATSFTVTVKDTTAPVITAHADVTAEATSDAGAVVTYASPATSDAVDGAGTATCLPASGSTFSMGNTTVTCNAVDAASNSATATSFTVTVKDTTAPVIAAHGNETAEATSAAGAAVTYASPATSDAVDGAGTATCLPASGSTFSLGTTTVTCNAVDAAGNSATATSFTVTVKDTTAPVIAAHGNETAEATSDAGAVVSYTSPATSDAVDGAGTATCLPASGSTFALGTTTVTCNAVDVAGNSATATTFVVHVVDTTPPDFSNVPASFSVFSTSGSGAVVNYTTPNATDIVDGPVPVSCLPASGSTFAVGATTVTCTSADAHGNAASRSFIVAVVYNWTGFFQPVDNPGPTNIVNVAKAGSAIPLKFSLGGSMGLDIFASGYPRVVFINTTAGAEDLIEVTVTAGASSLTYDPGANQYIYVWKTEKTWIGKSCQLQVKLEDGSLHLANFKFK